MKNIYFILTSVIFSSCATTTIDSKRAPNYSVCGEVTLPSQFSVTVPLSLTSETYEVKSNSGELLAKMTRTLGFGRPFEYYDAKNKLDFKTKQKLMSSGIITEASDCNDLQFGIVKTNYERNSIFSNVTHFDVFDQNNRLLYKVEIVDKLEDQILIKDTSGQLLTFIEMINGPNKWKVEIKDLTKINNRVIFSILSYKIYSERNKE